MSLSARPHSITTHDKTTNIYLLATFRTDNKPLITATAKKAIELFEDIIHRFDLPNSIITDLGSTFIGSVFWDFCEDRCISVKYVSVAHPRANGQVEQANGMILDALKKRLYVKEGEASRHMAQKVASYGLGVANSAQLQHGCLALLPGVRLGGRITCRCLLPSTQGREF